MTGLPPFCRVAGVIAPTSESQILFEVWMPLEKWNGKFAGVGNGGWAGTISFGALGDQLRRGYATASTNTGHEAAPGVEHGPVRAREARTADRLRVPLASRDGAQGEEPGAGVLRQAGRALVLHRLLVGRLRRPDGGAALSRRLRRHRRRRAGEQLDAADGRRFRRRARGAEGSGEPPAGRRRSACCIARRSPPATARTASSTA